MKVWQEQRLTGNRLTDAYLSGADGARKLYDHMTCDEGFIPERVSQLDEWFDVSRRRSLVAALRDYTQSVTGLNEMTTNLLDKLSDARCLTVVTGQQAGLFTGPLFTVYKALSAVQYAKHYETVTGRPVVPVFWIATEDHDFDEVASAYYVSQQGTVKRAHLRERPPLRTPVGVHVISDAEYTRILGELSNFLPDGMYKEDLLGRLAHAHHRSVNMGELFAKVLSDWLRDVPILILDPSRLSFRQIVRDAFAKVLADPRTFRDAAIEGSSRVSDCGFTPQVQVQPDHSLLYLIEGGRRSALDIDPYVADRYVLRDTKQTFTRDELLDRLEASPDHFSAGVLYRPVVQDHLLPVLAYVGGAAEVSYHGMMKEIFAAASRAVPPLHLRQRVMLVPDRVQRILEHHRLSLKDALSRDILKDLVETEVAPTINEMISRLEIEMLSDLEETRPYWLEMDETMEKALQRTRDAISRDLNRLRNRAHRAMQIRHSDVVTAMTAVSSWLRPEGEEQERVLSPLSVIAKYGYGWIGELLSQDLTPWDQITYMQW